MTVANIGDTTVFQAVLNDLPSIRTPRGSSAPAQQDPRDKGYDSHANRAYLATAWDHGVDRRRGMESSTRLGRHRWRVERSLSWLSCWRRLQVRWDRDSGRWFAFVLLACAVVCFNRL